MKKNFILGLMVVVSVAFTFSSCAKYEEGPKFSFLSKKSRLANTWKVENAKTTSSSGTFDFTSLMTDYTLVIEKDGKYSVTNGSSSDSGTWELGEDGDDVFFQSSQSGSSQEAYRILKLKSKELWWKHTNTNGSIDEFHFIEK
ncbi:hypothetical protein BH11BAC7_BH11BAC7_02420 [soil metagenome]